MNAETATEIHPAAPTYVVEGRRPDGAIKALDTFYSREAADEAHAQLVFSNAPYVAYRVRAI